MFSRSVVPKLKSRDVDSRSVATDVEAVVYESVVDLLLLSSYVTQPNRLTEPWCHGFSVARTRMRLEAYTNTSVAISVDDWIGLVRGSCVVLMSVVRRV